MACSWPAWPPCRVLVTRVMLSRLVDLKSLMRPFCSLIWLMTALMAALTWASEVTVHLRSGAMGVGTGRRG